MPRLLLISYLFAPEPSPGALRPGALARYLPEHGWEVDLVTRTHAPARDGRTIVVPHRPWIERLREDFRVRPDLWFRAPPTEHDAAEFIERSQGLPARLWNLFRASGLQAATWPDRSIDWAFLARGRMSDLVRERPPDAILSTSPPETAHFLGARAARISGAPWIADLRDPWSDTELMAHSRWRRWLDRMTEQQLLASTAALTTVSGPIAESLRDLHPGKRVRAILNGFDPADFPCRAAADRSRFAVLYTGSLTFGRHDVVTFLDGARRFLDANPRAALSLRFLGEDSPVLRERIAHYRLSTISTCEPRQGHAVAVDAMRTAPVLLFLPWQDPAHEGVYSAKLFEYIGARRPILAVGAIRGVAGALVEQTGAGRVAADAGQVAKLLETLHAAHLRGEDAWVASEAEVTRYSHREMVRQFAEELDRATRGRAH